MLSCTVRYIESNSYRLKISSLSGFFDHCQMSHFTKKLLPSLVCISTRLYITLAEVRCPTPPVFDNVIPSTLNTSYRTGVTFTCIYGHSFPDRTTKRTISCSASGEWIGLQELSSCQGCMLRSLNSSSMFN